MARWVGVGTQQPRAGVESTTSRSQSPAPYHSATAYHHKKHPANNNMEWQRPAYTPSSTQLCCGWHTHHKRGADSLPRLTANVLMRSCVEVDTVTSTRLLVAKLVCTYSLTKEVLHSMQYNIVQHANILSMFFEHFISNGLLGSK